MEQTREKIDLLGKIAAKADVMAIGMGALCPSVQPSVQMIADMNNEYIRRLQTGEKIAWLNFAVPPELFFAFDILPICSDYLAFQLAGEGMNLEYIDIGEEHVPDHVCADFKMHVGMFRTQDVPHPDMMIYSASPCDSMRTTYSSLAKYYDLPSFCLDAPYYRTERAYDYVAEEFKRLVTFLEEQTGKKLDMDKLREVMKNSNEAHYWYNKLNEFRPLIPNPFPSMELFMDGGPITLFTGKPELVDYYKKRYEEVKERVETGVGYPKSEEKIRTVWPYGIYVEDLDVLTWMEEKWGAVAVNWMRVNCTVEPTEDIETFDGIMRGLAKKAIMMPMNKEVHGPIENFIDATVDLVKKSSADAVITMGHVGCKANWGSMKLYKESVEEQTGCPLLVFELDLFDRRFLGVEGAKAKFQDFFETRVLPHMEKKKKG